MTTEYRVRYKKGDTEIEVQSGDEQYVNKMLDKLMSLTPHHQDKPSSLAPITRRKSQPHRGNEGGVSPQDTGVDAAKVANCVNEVNDHAKIEQNILNKSGRLAKILLAFHFAHECGYEQLTSGDVQKITDQLGVKVEQSNASHCISDNRKLFSASATRRKGAIIPYKLNRQGEQAYKTALATGKA